MVLGKLPWRNKRLHYALLITGLSLAALVNYCLNATPLSLPIQPLTPSPLAAQLALQAEDGDLVFRAGREVVSRMIIFQGDKATYSHVGIIVKQGDQLMVEHALPKEAQFSGGVVLESIDTFASVENAAAIGLSKTGAISRLATKNLHHYLLAQVGKPFDDDFKLSDDARMYCSELVLKAYQAGGVELINAKQFSKLMTLDEPVLLPDTLAKKLSAQSVLLLSKRL